ncbi:MAG: DUF1826 domain-containing protein [Myxococcales bacterium]|nr:DUF1826 domain-containing protein [Myxococcales bacterium]
MSTATQELESVDRRRRSFHISEERSVLQVVRRAGVNIAIWRRALPAWVTQAVSHWLLDASMERPSVELDFSEPEIDRSALVEPFGEPALRAWLEEDLLMLGRALASLAEQAVIRAELSAAHTDRCRKLHADYVGYRLITTYVGPATEWLPDDAVRRSAMAQPPACHREANALILREGRKVRRAVAGDVLVLQGERSAPGQGAVHRSPPIEVSGETRLVLTLTA